MWGEGDVIGTVSIPGMRFYYLEYLPLNDDATQPEGIPWIPATIAYTTSVVKGSLASLDTTQVSDGIYALRLVVITEDNETYTDTVTPIRVSNERFNNVIERIIAELSGEAPRSDGNAHIRHHRADGDFSNRFHADYPPRCGQCLGQYPPLRFGR